MANSLPSSFGLLATLKGLFVCISLALVLAASSDSGLASGSGRSLQQSIFGRKRSPPAPPRPSPPRPPAPSTRPRSLVSPPSVQRRLPPSPNPPPPPYRRSSPPPPRRAQPSPPPPRRARTSPPPAPRARTSPPPAPRTQPFPPPAPRAQSSFPPPRRPLPSPSPLPRLRPPSPVPPRPARKMPAPPPPRRLPRPPPPPLSLPLPVSPPAAQHPVASPPVRPSPYQSQLPTMLYLEAPRLLSQPSPPPVPRSEDPLAPPPDVASSPHPSTVPSMPVSSHPPPPPVARASPPPSSPPPLDRLSQPPTVPRVHPLLPADKPRSTGIAATSPSPAEDRFPGGGCDDAAAVVNATNVYRERHQVKNLQWSPALAAAAQAYAERLATQECPLKHGSYGENLMMWQQFPPPPQWNSCLGAVRGWYSQVLSYDFTTDRPLTVNWPRHTGHFTQLVWAGSSVFGCGVAVGKYPITYGNRTYEGACKMVVCRYEAPGNVASDVQFLKNVKRNTTACTL